MPYVKVCCCQSPCSYGRPLLTHASTGDTQTLKGRSYSVSEGPLGPGALKVLFEPSKHLWQVWGLILNGTSPLLQSYWGFLLGLHTGDRQMVSTGIILFWPSVKKAEHRRIDAFELWCWRRLLRVPWTARRVHSKGDQPWNFFGGNEAEAETPVLWPPHAKS